MGPYTAHFVGANKGTIVENRDDRFEFTALDPATIRALTFVSDLFNLHKVAKMDWNICSQGKAFMFNHPTTYNNLQNERVKQIINFRTVAYPTGPDNPDGKITLTPSNGAMSVIPVTANNPEGLARFMTAFFQTYNDPELVVSEDERSLNELSIIFGDDGEAIQYWMRARKNIDANKINYGAWGTPFSSIQTWVQTDVLKNLAKPSLSIRQYIDSILPVFQSEIDSLSGQ